MHTASPQYIEHQIQREAGMLHVRDYPGSAPAFVLMHGFPDNLHIYDVPVRIIWGAADPYLGTALAEDFRSRFRNVTLDLVDAGHWLQIDAPAEVAALMLASRQK